MGRWGNLIIPAVLNKTKAGFFFLDTGASVNVLSKTIAQEVASLRDIGKVIRGVSGKTQTYLAKNVFIQIGRFYQENDTILAIDMKDTSKKLGLEISGLLGYPLLKQLAITVDLRDDLIDFKYPFEKTSGKKKN